MELDLKLTADELNMILFGLQKLPWENSNKVIIKIQDQVRIQLATPKAEKVEDKKAESKK